ncbi:MAG: hypothetical protein AB8F78_09870 [Saprospiraceae bacterium]
MIFILLSFSVVLSAQNAIKPIHIESTEDDVQSHSPSHWGLKSAIGIGWPQQLQLLDQTTSDLPYVGLIGLQYRRAITSRLAYAVTAEFMLVHRSGDLAGRDYRMRKLVPGIEGLLAYQLPNPRWHLHAGMQMRTHRRISSIDIKRRDNFRFEQRIMGSYYLSREIHLTTTIGRSLRSRDDSAYFSDPQLQMLIGLLWMFRPQ